MEEYVPVSPLSHEDEQQEHNVSVSNLPYIRSGGELSLKAEGVFVINYDEDELEPVLDGVDPAADPIGYYLQSIGRMPLLTAEQEASVAERIQAGLRASKEPEDKTGNTPTIVGQDGQIRLAKIIEDGEIAKSQLIEANLRLVVSIANKHRGKGTPWLDLVAEGNLELTKIVEKFDPTKGIKFSSFAYGWIEGAVKRAVSERQEIGAIRVPTRQYHDSVRLQGASRELIAEKGGRMPTEEELCCRLGWTPRKLKYVLAGEAGSRSVLSLDWTGSKRKSGKLYNTGNGFGNRIGTQALTCNPLAVSEVKALHQAVRAARDTLQGRQREIIELIFWAGRTNREIAEQYGVKPQRIQQIKTDALMKLRDRFPDLYEFLQT